MSRSSTRAHALWIGLALFGWIAGSPALAETAETAGIAESGEASDPARAAPADQIVVTAQRREQPLSRVPGAVGIVNADQIQLAQPQLELGESIARIPGVFAQNRTNFAQDSRISIRGFGARSSFGIRGIKILVDEIPATLPDGLGQVDTIDLSSTDSIEVLRGPSSALYGGASGGVIRITSESGGPTPLASSRFAAGDHGYRSYRAKVSGSGTGPADKLAYLVSYARNEVDGYRDHSRSESWLVKTKLDYAFSEASNLTVLASHVRSPQADDPGGVTALDLEADRRAAREANEIFDAGESLDQTSLGAVYRHRFGERHETTLRHSLVWRDFDNRLPFETGGSVDLDRFFVGGGVQHRYEDEWFERANVVMLGIDVEAQLDHRKRFDNEEGSRGELTFDQDEDVLGLGVFLQDEFAFTETLRATGAARYDRIEFDVDDDFEDAGDLDDSGDLDFDEWSFLAGLVWNPHPALNPYAKFSTSFETPTTTELADPEGEGGFNSDLEAQTALNFELGLRGSAFGRVRYEFAVFHIRLDDELVPFERPESPGRIFFENSGESRRTGVEMSATVDLLSYLSASASYTYSDFEYEDFEDVEGERHDGNQIPGVPIHHGFAGLSLHHPAGTHADFEVEWASKRYANNANTASAESQVVANLRAGHRFRFTSHGALSGLEIHGFAGIKNLFDEKYIDNVRSNAFGGRYFEAAPKREFYGGLSLSYSFDALDSIH